MQNTGLTDEIRVVAERIREMREIIGFTVEEMAEKTNLRRILSMNPVKSIFRSPLFINAPLRSASELRISLKATAPIFRHIP